MGSAQTTFSIDATEIQTIFEPIDPMQLNSILHYNGDDCILNHCGCFTDISYLTLRWDEQVNDHTYCTWVDYPTWDLYGFDSLNDTMQHFGSNWDYPNRLHIIKYNNTYWHRGRLVIAECTEEMLSNPSYSETTVQEAFFPPMCAREHAAYHEIIIEKIDVISTLTDQETSRKFCEQQTQTPCDQCSEEELREAYKKKTCPI